MYNMLVWLATERLIPLVGKALAGWLSFGWVGIGFLLDGIIGRCSNRGYHHGYLSINTKQHLVAS